MRGNEMIEHHRHHFNEIMARREAMRKLKRQQKWDAVIALITVLASGAALGVLVVLSVAMLSTPR
ncbi:MAG: hypothetical protein LW689_06140 [Novosphingobium sp.]|nr:hypothetical protein [Novosphingobium sp.]MCE2842347.1 hypothetical protein [Novosphingobium sp.]